MRLPEIPSSHLRDELRSYARTEFERNRGVTDVVSLGSFYLSLSNLCTDWDVIATHKISALGMHDLVLQCRRFLNYGRLWYT